MDLSVRKSGMLIPGNMSLKSLKSWPCWVSPVEASARAATVQRVSQDMV